MLTRGHTPGGSGHTPGGSTPGTGTGPSGGGQGSSPSGGGSTPGGASTPSGSLGVGVSPAGQVEHTPVGSSGTLPFTGYAVGGVAAIGAAVSGAGIALRRKLGRRP